jgi:hypothetical protein
MKAERELSIERMLGLGRVSRSSFYSFDAEATPGPDPDMDLRDAIQRIAVEMPGDAQLRPAADHRRAPAPRLDGESQAGLPSDARG